MLLPLLVYTAGCATAAAEPPQEGRPQLVVSVAASLREAMPEIGALFTRETGARVVVNSGASGVLARQVAAGAPVDVFASASEREMTHLVESGSIRRQSVRVFAGNTLVLVARGAGNPSASGAYPAATGFSRLTRPEVKRIALGNPDTTPHGAAAMETLRSLGLVETVRPKLVYTENVAQTRDYIARGEVDAAFLFASEVRPGSGLEVLATAPAGSYAPLVDVVGVAAHSAQAALAERFTSLLLSSEAQAILARHGFQTAPRRSAP